MGYLKKLEEDKKLKMRYNLCEMLYVQLMTVAEIKKWTYDSYKLEEEQIKEIVLDVNNESPYIKSLFTTENIIKETRLILYKGLIEGKGVGKIAKVSPYSRKSISMILYGITARDEYEVFTNRIVSTYNPSVLDMVRTKVENYNNMYGSGVWISELYKYVKNEIPREYSNILSRPQLYALTQRYGNHRPLGNPFMEGRKVGFNVNIWTPNKCLFMENIKETVMVTDICDLLYIENLEPYEIVKELRCSIQLVNKIRNKSMYTDISNMFTKDFIDTEIKSICYYLWERKYHRKGVIKVSAINRKTTTKIMKRQLFKEISEPYVISSLNDLSDELKECIKGMVERSPWANMKTLAIYNELLKVNTNLLYKKGMIEDKNNLYEKIFIMSIIDYYRETRK